MVTRPGEWSEVPSRRKKALDRGNQRSHPSLTKTRSILVAIKSGPCWWFDQPILCVLIDWSKSLPEPVFSLYRMAGRCRGSSQRRVRGVGFDSRSTDPHTVALTRGSPSPTAPHFRRAPLSPGLLHRHMSSPSPLLSSSPDSEECGSMEEGVSPDPDVASSQLEILSEVAVGSRLIPEVSILLEGSISAASSGSSTLSTTTAVLLCQDSIVAVVHKDDRMQLVRSESVCSNSSPSLDGPDSVSDGVR
ncbi:hypothetical protein Dimus_037723 [Dionaea muscipula]